MNNTNFIKANNKTETSSRLDLPTAALIAALLKRSDYESTRYDTEIAFCILEGASVVKAVDFLLCDYLDSNLEKTCGVRFFPRKTSGKYNRAFCYIYLEAYFLDSHVHELEELYQKLVKSNPEIKTKKFDLEVQHGRILDLLKKVKKFAPSAHYHTSRLNNKFKYAFEKNLNSVIDAYIEIEQDLTDTFLAVVSSKHNIKPYFTKLSYKMGVTERDLLDYETVILENLNYMPLTNNNTLALTGKDPKNQ